MEVLIVYESMYGNTRGDARAALTGSAATWARRSAARRSSRGAMTTRPCGRPVVLGEAAAFDRPQVAWDARGRAIAAWLASRGLRAATFPPGPAWTPATALAERAGYWPVVTKGPHVLAAWTAKRAVRARSWSVP